MQEPAELISMSTPAIGMEFVAGSAAAGAEKVEQLREWLFTQTVGIRERASSVTMIYAGMADGHFVGCECAVLSARPVHSSLTRMCADLRTGC